MPQTARACWLVTPGQYELRDGLIPHPGDGEVEVRTIFSGVSRGTESLVFHGQVPPSQYARMRAPFQEGEFPGPVKYGYLNVGIVEDGAEDLRGHTVFCLYPHQTRFVVPVDAVVEVPDGVPARRAVLAGIMETAVNALWDAAPVIGDRIAVIGAGAVGCCLARLLTAIPGTHVVLCDVDTSRANAAAKLGVEFGTPGELAGDYDVVFHASATGPGLQLAVDLLADEGRVIELSWYGDAVVPLELGGSFHSRRLQIISSQVGRVPPPQRPRRDPRDRLALALWLLRDPAYDALLTGTTPFTRLPEVLPELAGGTLPAICHTVDY